MAADVRGTPRAAQCLSGWEAAQGPSRPSGWLLSTCLLPGCPPTPSPVPVRGDTGPWLHGLRGLEHTLWAHWFPGLSGKHSDPVHPSAACTHLKSGREQLRPHIQSPLSGWERIRAAWGRDPDPDVPVCQREGEFLSCRGHEDLNECRSGTLDPFLSSSLASYIYLAPTGCQVLGTAGSRTNSLHTATV